MTTEEKTGSRAILDAVSPTVRGAMLESLSELGIQAGGKAPVAPPDSLNPITRAFESIATLPALEGGFLRLLLQAIDDPELATCPGLAEHILLVPQVVRALPSGLARIIQSTPRGSVGHRTLAAVTQTVALASDRDISPETLARLSLVALRDAASLENFLEGRLESPLLMTDIGDGDLPTAPIAWRNLSFTRHSPGIWLTADRLWKLQNAGEPHWVAFLQFDPDLTLVESAPTAAEAIDKLIAKAKDLSFKLWAALDPVTDP